MSIADIASQVALEIAVKKAVISGHNSRLRSLFLTKTHMSLYRWIRKFGPMTTVELCAERNISMSTADAQMKKLYNLGYTTRESIPTSRGGHNFMYTIVLAEDL